MATQFQEHLDRQGTGARTQAQAAITGIEPGELRRQFNAKLVEGLMKVFWPWLQREQSL